MTVERIKSGFLAAPDFKVTRFDRRTSEIAGAYAGWLADQQLFVGGGAYWLANGNRDRELAYGGLVVGWSTRADRQVGLGVKGLIGGGEATLTETASLLLYPTPLPIPTPLPTPNVITGRPLPTPPTLTTVNVRVRDSFFVAEPEATVFVKLARSVRLTGGVGYRLVDGGRTFNHDDRDTRLRGASGSIALQIGGGS
jgi:hypothetical protein